jgi:glutamate racemase
MKQSIIKNLNLILILSSLLNVQCSSDRKLEFSSIDKTILSDTTNFFYIDVKKYPVKDKYLPIGIFDSGTGGLTVMDAIINFDGFDNESGKSNSDGVLDFEKEYFIYLADQANMPYGNYPSERKTDVLKEHILKDVQFLLDNKYYRFADDEEYQKDKQPVKAIVIACNTATAYGMEDIESFLKRADLDIKVIGVINAGVKGALENISKSEDFSIAVMATEGTVLSNGYVNAINDYVNNNGYKGDVNIFQQAGVGLAGAIDGVSDYISSSATSIRKEYKGPSLSNANAKIDKIILSRYNFDWGSNRILFTGEKNNPIEIQLNSIENYIYYNVVSLLEQIRKSETAKPLKTIILGCTHYPFYTTIFEKKLKELYNYKENGEYVYKKFMKEEITLIDPAVNTAKELYAYLNENDLFNNSSMDKSEFYISVPNILNENVKTDSAGNFTYEYKYGRDAGNIQQYVKRVPFNKSNLYPDVIDMLKDKTPLVYQLITDFNQKNEKTIYLRQNKLGLL